MTSREWIAISTDLAFAVAGIAATVALWRRSNRRGEAKEPPPPCPGEILTTLGALACAAVGPNILVIATTPGLWEMPDLARIVLVPSLLALGGVALWASVAPYDRLSNRLWAGISAGAATTGCLDAVRLTGFYLGLMPGNMPRMFGVLLLDRMALGPSPLSDLLGYSYHYWVGACFGLVYTLVCGRLPWWGGLVWGLVIEVGMMTTPPMVIAMDTGYFGLKLGYGLLGTSLVAHIVYGVALGTLAQRLVRHRGSLLSVLGISQVRPLLPSSGPGE